MLKNFYIQSILLTSLLFTISFSFIQCSKDEEKCTNFSSNGQTLTANGTSQPVSVCQLTISDFLDLDNYSMNISYISESCNKMSTLNLTILLPKGQKLDGTFQIKSFFDSDTGDGFGSLTEQVISPLSQNSVDLASGTAKFIDKGGKKYNVDIVANTIAGASISIKGDLQF